MTVKIAQKQPVKNPDPKKDRGKAGVFPKAQANADLDQVNDAKLLTAIKDFNKLAEDPNKRPLVKQAVDNVISTLHIDSNGKEVPEPLKLEEMAQRFVDQAIAGFDVPAVSTLSFKPQVTVNGKVIEAFETIEPKRYGEPERFCSRLHVKGELVEIYQHRACPIDLPRLRAYEIEVEGRTTILLLDELSSVTITDNSPDHPWGRGRSNKKDSSIAVLINSTSNNDRFYGQSLLYNVESVNNLLNHSNLRCHNDLENLRAFYPDDVLRLKNDFQADKSRRMRVVDGQFKYQTVIDTDLDGGVYLHGILDQVVFKSRNIDLNDCTLTKCQISGSAIKMRKVTLEECQINADGRVEIRKQRFFQKSFYPFSAIYLINKFCYTEIHLADAYQDLQLMRTGKTTYELAMGGTVAKITAPTNDYDLRKAIAAVKREEEITSWDQDPFSQSLNQYVVDCITSRIKIIGALDKAIDAAEHLTGNTDRYESPYGN